MKRWNEKVKQLTQLEIITIQRQLLLMFSKLSCRIKFQFVVENFGHWIEFTGIKIFAKELFSWLEVIKPSNEVILSLQCIKQIEVQLETRVMIECVHWTKDWT